MEDPLLEDNMHDSANLSTQTPRKRVRVESFEVAPSPGRVKEEESPSMCSVPNF
jgi:hypothetical protein